MTAVGLGLGGALSPLGLPGSLTATFDFAGSILEGFGASDLAAPNNQYDDVLTDDLGITYRTVEVRALNALLAIGLGLTDVSAYALGVRLLEGLGLLGTLHVNEVGRVVAAEGLGLGDEPLAAWPLTLSESLGLAPTLVAQQAITVLEALGIAPALVAAAIHQMPVAEALGFADSLANFFGGEISETLGLDPTISIERTTYSTLSEGLGLAPSAQPTMVFRVTTEDTLDLDAETLVQALYSGEIEEGLELAVGYLTPGGGFTTWAMNTRNAVVTEYTNYEFNSFARLGNKYLGASSNGLYALTGDDDDGENIIATIRSGFAQFAGARFALLRRIYIAARGDGDWVLRLITGDGTIYNYAVTMQSMRTTRVHLGKGLKTRYWAFELVSTGQDFDLESLEFVPLASDRRV